MGRTYCGDVLLQNVPTPVTTDAGGGYYHTSTADTDSWTKLRRLHHRQPEHVSRCLGSAALRGGYDDDSILRLIRDD